MLTGSEKVIVPLVKELNCMGKTSVGSMMASHINDDSYNTTQRCFAVMTMNKSSQEVYKLNLHNMKAPYVITGIIFLAMLVQDFIKALIAYNSGDMVEQFLIRIGNYLWLLIPLVPIFVATKNFRRPINLGSKRSNISQQQEIIDNMK